MRMVQELRQDNKNELKVYRKAASFVPAGQSTQMIIGATKESDYQILNVAEALYQKFDLKRVFYSAFVNVNQGMSYRGKEEGLLPVQGPEGPPLLREHRLYQADWLLRYYHFEAKEILTEDSPNFNIWLDPKCNWALKHLEFFPVEVNTADYQTLLRVPGLGWKSAQRIVRARRFGRLTFTDLKKMGVVLKRAVYFLTCGGKTMYPVKIEEDYILRNLLHTEDRIPKEVKSLSYQQLSLFDDVKFRQENACEVISG